MQSFKNDNTELLVVVWMITYNHEKYIEQAVESFMMQQTCFNYTLLIGDDCSTDNTRKIIIDLKKKYGNKITLLLNEKNLGVTKNAINVYKICFSSGAKYIALCEGDDYWTDPNKLQKQVDFLETHPEYAICFHAVNILENGKERPSELNRSDKEETYSILDLANGNIMHTPSVVFRNGLIEQFPAWFNESPVGDYVLHLLNAKKGLIKYFPDIMAVYRVHSEGTWGQKKSRDTIPKWLQLLDNLINEDFSPETKHILQQQKTEGLKDYIGLLIYEEEYALVKKTIRRFCDQDETATINFVTEKLIERITNLEQHIQALKTTGTYKLAKNLSFLKSTFKAKQTKPKKQ